MRSQVLLLAGLGVPFTLCFDAETYLSGEFLKSLPIDAASSGSDLRAVLKDNPILHFDEAHKKWDASHIKVFNEQYFPALKEFVTLAVRYLGLLYKTVFPKPHPSSQPQPLVQVLDHLLGSRHFDDHVFNVAPTLSECTIPLMMAKADFMALRGAYKRFCRDRPKELKSPNLPQWLAESSTFGPAVEIAREARIVASIFSKIRGFELTTEQSVYLEAVRSNVASLPILTQRLKTSIYKLPEAFHSLQTAAEELAKAGCDWSWIDSACYLWSSILDAGTECVSQIWGQQDGETTAQRDIIGEFAKAVNQLRTKLLAGTMLLRPTAIEIRTLKKVSFDEQKLREKIKSWLRRNGEYLAQISRDTEDFVAEQKGGRCLDVALVTGVTRLELQSSDKMHGIAVDLIKMAKRLAKRLPRDMKALALERATVSILGETHGDTKRVVEAYGALLDLERQKLGASEFDMFLQQIMGKWYLRELLERSLYLMGRIEEVEGVIGPAESYDQSKCPLRRVLYGSPENQGAMDMFDPFPECDRARGPGPRCRL